MTQALSEETLNQLFFEPRTVNKFTDEPVSEETLRDIWNLTKMGPTAFNSQPLRITFVQSDEARARLKPLLSRGNQEKTMAAPVVAVMAYDTAWHERFPEFNARAAEAGLDDMYSKNEELKLSTGLQSATLATGYFITAARAMGLSVGPMSGADFAGIDREFFPEGNRKSFLVINLGYGVQPSYERNPRFELEQATQII